MLLPRVLTALVGVPLILFLIHLGSVPFLVFTVCVTGLACWEYAAVIAHGGLKVQKLLVAPLGMLVALAAGLSVPSLHPGEGGRLAALGLSVCVAVPVLRELFGRDHDWQRAANTLLGALFIGWGLSHLVWLRQSQPGGRELAFLLFATVWVSDIAAYFAGVKLGTRPLAPVVSPKKTWEGLLAGLAAGGAAVVAARRFGVLEGLAPWTAFGLGVLLAAVSQVSDLSESMAKRAGGVKDSARLLPGHGGVMDRFDSYYLAAPLFYYLVPYLHG